MFFITAFERLPNSQRSLSVGSMSVFGYFEKYEDAVERLHNNTCDMHELLYDFAVVEEIPTGIHPDVQSRQFFAFDKARDGFFEIDEPKEVMGLCNFALG